MEIIDAIDLVLLPFFILFFFLCVRQIAKANYTDLQLRKYYVNGYLMRVAGVVGYSLLIKYYYGYGDSYNFYYGGEFIKQALLSGKISLLNFFEPAATFADKIPVEEGYNYANGMMHLDSNLVPMKIFSLLSIVCFGNFLLMSLVTALFSFLGAWQLFKVGNKILQGQHTRLWAWAALYSPSICMWGSGLMKESICIGCLGFLVSIIYGILTTGKVKLTHLAAILGLGLVIYQVKNYIIILGLLCLLLSVIFYMFRKVHNVFFRFIIIGFLLVISVGIFALFDFTSVINNTSQDTLQQLAEFKSTYEKIQEFDETSRAGISMTLDYSVGGLLLKSPLLVLGCLFRPFIFEATKLIIFFSSLESTLLLIVVLKLLFNNRKVSFFGSIFSNSYVSFCFLFTIFFAGVVGLTTFNVGTLVRYKVIFLPFCYFMLVYIYAKIAAKPKPQPIKPSLE